MEPEEYARLRLLRFQAAIDEALARALAEANITLGPMSKDAKASDLSPDTLAAMAAGEMSSAQMNELLGLTGQELVVSEPPRKPTPEPRRRRWWWPFRS